MGDRFLFLLKMKRLFFIALFLVILIVRYAPKVKLAVISSTFLAMKNKSLSYTMLHRSIVTHAQARRKSSRAKKKVLARKHGAARTRGALERRSR